MKRTIELRLTRQDKAAGFYHYAPFEVPEGTTRIDVALAFDRSGGCELNFGLFDPTATEFPSAGGIRGWSPDFHETFFTATDDASPGYLWGPIVAGQWQLMIGLGTIPTGGVTLRIEIGLDAAPRPTTPQPVRLEPVRKGAGWYRGDTHCHTFHSDADGSPETLHAAARQAGLDFLAVADHNTTSQRRYFYPASSPELVFVRAMEVTTHNGHANAFGVEGMIDYRLTRPDDVHRLVEHVHARGGILSVNHDKPTIPWGYELPRVDCMEVWQSTWIEWNWISLARYQHRLAAGLRISAIGGSDYHQPAELRPESPFVLARPTTVLWLEELSEAAIIAAMKAGHGYITEDPKGPHLAITADGQPMGSLLTEAREVRAEVRGAAGDRLVWIDASGALDSVVIGSDDWSTSFDTPARIATFIRAEIIAKASYERLYQIAEAALPEAPMVEQLVPIMRQQAIRRAISNPIYFGH
ncbi:MAG TPA: CehA/McbA family metallohydrolase [Devosia sp.]|nr:CehA/McbA family metallohydrolase [Devosia sp.]